MKPNPKPIWRSRELHRWSRRLHLYAGLLTFSSLLLLGIGGLTAFVHQSQDWDGTHIEEDRLLPFRVEEGESDLQILNRVRSEFDLPLTVDLTEGAAVRNGDENPTATFYTVNGRFAVTVFVERSQVQIVEIRRGFPAFLLQAHATLLRDSWRGQDWRVLMLSIYAAVTLSLLTILVPSGLAIWFTGRAKQRRMRLALAASSGLFVTLWLMIQ